MELVNQLTKALEGALAVAGFAGPALDGFGGLVLAAEEKPRLLCAVAELPETAVGAAGAKAFIQHIRRQLSDRYAGFRWPKRLGTYVVLLAGRGAYEALAGRTGDLIDAGGLHVNVVLGAVLVDTDMFQCRSDNTWGIIDDRGRFRHVQHAVEAWCRARRHELRLDR
jgi:hypothetical protein